MAAAKLIPFAGALITISMAYALTWAIGEVSDHYFRNGRGVPQSELVLGGSEARTGQQLLSEHFPGGSGSPVYVVTDEAKLQQVADLMLADSRIESVAVSSEDSPSGSAPVTEDGVQPLFPGAPASDPTVSDGEVLLQGTLTVAPDSAEADFETVFSSLAFGFADASPAP